MGIRTGFQGSGTEHRRPAPDPVRCRGPDTGRDRPAPGSRSLRHLVIPSFVTPDTGHPKPGTRYLSRSDAEDRGLEHAPGGFAIIPRVFGLSP